jgi:hypothetical protein
MSYSPTLFSGMYAYFLFTFARILLMLLSKISSARRNDQGQLEPDAAEDVVQNSLGFGGYELAPKSEHRKEGPSSSPPSS